METQTEKAAQKHILFVDDGRILRSIQVAALKQKGFKVTEAENGIEALKILASDRPDIVITGISMPQLGGFDLMEKMRADESLKNIPVFVYSHRGRPEDKEKAFSLGAANFFVYGYATPNDIAETIKRYLGENSTYQLRMDLRFLDGPNFRRDLRGILPLTDSVTVIVEAEGDPAEGKFKMHLPPKGQ